MAERKLSEVKRIEVVESYNVLGITTYKELLDIPWEKAKTNYVYDPHDKKVFQVSELREWIQHNPKYGQRQLLLIEFPEEIVRRIYK